MDLSATAFTSKRLTLRAFTATDASEALRLPPAITRFMISALRVTSRSSVSPPALGYARGATAAAPVRTRAHRLPAATPNRPPDHDLYIKGGQADIAKAAIAQPRQLVVLTLKLHVTTDTSGKKTNAGSGR
jgi:hypothetical protein